MTKTTNFKHMKRPYRAHIESTDGRRLCILTITADDLRQAEQHAIAKAALNFRSNPAHLIVRKLHEQTPAGNF
jgi:hypothetical protein